jgi:transposase-like protein
MTWKKTASVEFRRAFVEAALAGVEPMQSLCRRHGISRVTGYKWLARFRAGGVAALADRSHRPHAPR